MTLESQDAIVGHGFLLACAMTLESEDAIVGQAFFLTCAMTSETKSSSRRSIPSPTS